MAGDHLRRARVSVDDLPRSYVCYDLETTGLGAAAHVIEIGAVRVFDGWEDERLSTFVALPAGARIEPGAQAVHHISEAMLAGAPSQREAYETFSEFVENIVEGKIIIGQLDEADVSIRQLNTIKEVLKGYLSQIYHERVVYPNRTN